MAQAVKTAVRAVRPGLDAQRVHDPVEQPTYGVQAAQPVFFFREKHIVVRFAESFGGLVSQQSFVNIHRLRQTDRGRFVALDLGRCEAQIVELAADDFYVFVFQLPHIARAQKRVDHETYQPVHLQGHAAVFGFDVKPRVRFVPMKHVAAQGFGLTQYGRVLGDGEGAARLLRDLHFGEQRHLCNVFLLDQITQHFAQLRDVADDGWRGQVLVGQKVDETLDAAHIDAAQIGIAEKICDMRFQPDLGHAVGAFGDLVAHHFVLFLGQDDADHLVDGDKTTGLKTGAIYKCFSVINTFFNVCE